MASNENDVGIEAIRLWLDAALRQIAAESYLQGVNLANVDLVSGALLAGNTPPGTALNQQQYIRMVPSQAADFLATYEIVDHHANDASGFSATLLRRKVEDPITNAQAGTYTLAIRSTEYKNPSHGGDFDRDGIEWKSIKRADGEDIWGQNNILVRGGGDCGMKSIAKNVTRLALLGALALATCVRAQGKPESLEPLPTDPEKRVYYGEYYSPERYAECWNKWGNTNDVRQLNCDVYKERLEPFDPARRESFGEFYDPKRYHECRHKYEERETRCEYLKLRRQEPQEHWPYPNIAKPKWPEAPNPPVYRWWMSSKRYFEALCKAEAGEFIYRKVSDVDGIFQIRGRSYAGTYARRDRYVMEDPYGYTDAAAQLLMAVFVGPKKYRYVELMADPRFVPNKEDVVVRYSGIDPRSLKPLKREYDSKLESRYGYTWRGIKRPKDREHGIAGGEFIVVDLATNEILALRRGFIRAAKSSYSEGGLTWEYGEFCPLLSERSGIAKDYDASFAFAARVLEPAR